MKKRTPDAKAWFGITAGGVAALIAGLLTHFGFNVTGSELTLITTGVGLLGHFAGTYFAPYEPRIAEIVAEAKRLLKELESA